jgi:N4-(beta-N-acetylglucosaminyl)-L-asparaginase
LDQGFERKNLLTKKAEEAWKEWLTDANYQPVINSENHDTIGMLAIDEDGNIAGACTTSGMAYKLHGRVGDSPIIGAGLFIDGEVGGACATGVGEAVIKTAGSAMVVELMRNGNSPEEACRIVAERVVSKYEKLDNLQVGFIALNKDGVFGSYSIYEGFEVAKTDKASAELIKSPFKLKWG